MTAGWDADLVPVNFHGIVVQRTELVQVIAVAEPRPLLL